MKPRALLPGAANRFGRSVAGAGDVDRDGFPDLLVGAPDSRGLAAFPGAAWLYSGRTGTVLRTFVPFGPPGGWARWSRSAGDMDGDGWLDQVILAGEPGSSGTAAEARVFSRRAGALQEAAKNLHRPRDRRES